MAEEKRNKKVIIFGGAGFLGSHVADNLTERGYEVVIFDLKKSPYLKEGQTSIVGDIADQKAVEEVIKGCRVVYNFAGVADLEEANTKPLDSVYYNIFGNTVLLEAARKNNVERFIFASTLHVYSKVGSFYRSSKQACELLIEDYQELYGLNYTILRFGSLYGPRSEDKNWIYRSIKQAISQGKITRPGDGEEIREYIHVYDAARLSVDILSEEYKNQHVIISGNQSIKVRDCMNMIREMLDNKVELEYLPDASMAGHYKITPYNFTPKLAKRIQSAHYIDLGQGLLDLMDKIHHESFCASSSEKEIKAVIFDFDGVILESVGVKTEAFRHMFEGYPEHLRAILALHKEHGGMSRFEKFERIYRDILNQPLSEEKKSELGKQFSSYVYQGVLTSPFVDGAKEFLAKYYQKLPLFIASGTPDGEIKSLVKEGGLEKYFRSVFGSPARKAEIIANILKEFNFQPQEVIFVGDAIEDYDGAKEAGVKFIWRTKENNPFQELEKIIHA